MDRIEAATRELVDALRQEIVTTAQPSLPDRLLGIQAAAEALSIGRTALYQEIAAGRIRTVKVGRRRLVPAGAIRDYIETAQLLVTERIRGHANRTVARQLWDRDGGRCWRCGKPIDLMVSAMLPGGLTIGHKIPHSLGGTNAPANLGPEHRCCNLGAGAKVQPRALLVTPPRPAAADGR